MISVPVSVLDLATVNVGASTAEALSATLELARAADDLGCERFWTAEHHNMPAVAATSPAVLIAALGAATTRIRVGSGGVMLPNHSSYVVAEQFALLEGLYPGRVDLGIGRAPGTDQVTAWALRRDLEGASHESFEEDLGLLRAWLSPAGVATGAGRRLSATPAATSYPEVWLLGSSDYSARLAARLGLRYCYAGHFGALDPAGVLRMYASEFVPSAGLAAPHPMVCVSAITADTEDEAQFLAGPARVRWLGMRSGEPAPMVTPEEASRRLGADAASVPAVNHVGTPAHVTAEIEGLIAASGAVEVMIAGSAYDVGTRIETLRALAS